VALGPRLHADRKRPHQRAVAAQLDREVVPVEPRFEHAIDGVEEIVAVLLQVKAEQVGAEHAVEDLRTPRADAKRLGIGPRDVPEQADAQIGTPFLDEARHQRQLVVLHQHHRLAAADLVQHRLGEAPVDLAIVFPVGGAEQRAFVRQVAQRPQALVRKAVVVTLLLFARQPHALERVARILGRDREPAVGVGTGAIGVAGAMRDPHPAAGLQHRIERGHQPAGRHDGARLAVAPLVHVRLAIAHHDQLVGVAERGQRVRPQPIGRPHLLAVQRRLRQGLAGGTRGAERRRQPVGFAAQQPRRQAARRRLGDVLGAQPPHPVGQPVQRALVGEPGAAHHQRHRQQRDDQHPEGELREARERAVVEKRHVLHDHHQAPRRSGFRQRLDQHVHAHAGDAQQLGDLAAGLACRAHRAVEPVGKSRHRRAGREQRAVGAKHGVTEQPLVTLETGLQGRARLRVRECQRLGHPVGELLRQDVGAAGHVLEIDRPFAVHLAPGEQPGDHADDRGDQQSETQGTREPGANGAGHGFAPSGPAGAGVAGAMCSVWVG
jgi:hypothetical protein